jgi:hypothetical protein
MASPTQTTGSLQFRPGQVAAIVGVFASGFAIWILPWVLGPIAIIFGGVAMARGERRGLWVIGLAVFCIALGLVIHALPDEVVGG